MNSTGSTVLAWAAQASTPGVAAAPATGTGTATAAAPTPDNPFPLMYGVAIIFLLWWVMIHRPNRAEQRKRQELLDGVGKGDSVVTTGGLIGVVESVDVAKGIVTLTIAPKVSAQFTKAAIASVTPRKGKNGGTEVEKTA